ncbi:MAG: Adenylate cyclase [Candidatus Ozemobacter sibiricus]|jgi:class 3 adenylate cyclase|uniref:Adenylate cyclase n=1 Tax=Candidatus Ozemobacter sibiricus TaxID=2268124 RepID=A0A367ZPM1_9BACT|nr:MAG: Adenylate cyclase [Candidatus Ozemobacter sibiricus]
MPSITRRLSPYLLPFLLSTALLAIAWTGLSWQEAFRRQQARFAWEQEARAALARLRTTHTIEAQIDVMGAGLIARLERAMTAAKAGNPDRRLARAAPRAWHRSFPATHRPPGSQMYVFRLAPDGTAALVRGPGLASKGGRLLTDLFRAFTEASRQGAFPPAQAGRINRLTKGAFGSDAEAHLLAVHRRGRLTPIDAEGRRAFLFWDVITVQGQPVGGVFLIFPGAIEQQARPLEHCLEGVRRATRGRLLPVLLPVPQVGATSIPAAALRPSPSPRGGKGPDAREPANRRGQPAVGPRWARSAPRAEARQTVRFLQRIDRARPDLTAEKTWDLAGRWVMKGFFSYDEPYTAWVVSREGALVASARPRQLLLLALFGLGWGIAAIGVLFRSDHAVPLRVAFPVILFLLGALPVAGLLGLGWIHFDTGAERDIQRTGREAQNWIASLDSRSSQVLSALARASQAVVQRPDVLRWIYDPRPTALPPAARALLSALQREGLGSTTAFLFRPGEPGLVWPPTNVAGLSNRPQLDIFAPMIYLAHQSLQPIDHPLPPPLLERSQEWWLTVYAAMGASDSRNLFLDIEEAGEFGKAGREQAVFQISHQFTAGSSTRAYLMLQMPTEMAFRAFFFRHLAQAALDPARTCYLGRFRAGGCELVFPPPGSPIWSDPQARHLARLLHETAYTGTGRLVRQGDRLLVTGMCARFLPFVVGLQIRVDDILNRAWRNKAGLVGFSVVVLVLVTLLGRQVSQFLIDPLLAVERGLQRVTAGDLTVRVALPRADALGELTRAVDTMVEGLQERRNLGRFVPGSLERVLQEPGAGDLEEPRLVTGALLVSDIRGFTTLSEREQPEDVVRMLNAHFDEMGLAIEHQGGRIDQFIGDAIVAFFPGEAAGAARRALAAALTMRAAHQALQRQRRQQGLFLYEIGVGVAAGQFLVGVMRGRERAEFAVLGPGRHEAERLEGLSRTGSHTRVVVGEAVHQMLADAFVWAEIPGRQRAWEVVAVREGPA